MVDPHWQTILENQGLPANLVKHVLGKAKPGETIFVLADRAHRLSQAAVDALLSAEPTDTLGEIRARAEVAAEAPQVKARLLEMVALAKKDLPDPHGPTWLWDEAAGDLWAEWMALHGFLDSLREYLSPRGTTPWISPPRMWLDVCHRMALLVRHKNAEIESPALGHIEAWDTIIRVIEGLRSLHISVAVDQAVM